MYDIGMNLFGNEAWEEPLSSTLQSAPVASQISSSADGGVDIDLASANIIFDDNIASGCQSDTPVLLPIPVVTWNVDEFQWQKSLIIDSDDIGFFQWRCRHIAPEFTENEDRLLASPARRLFNVKLYGKCIGAFCIEMGCKTEADDGVLGKLHRDCFLGSICRSSVIWRGLQDGPDTTALGCIRYTSARWRSFG